MNVTQTTPVPVDLSPSDTLSIGERRRPILLLACGALAREIVDLVQMNDWQAFDIQCLPAKWHNTPQHIVPALREKIIAARDDYEKIFVVYGDCGTGGLLDAMLAEYGVERIAGPHCYAFYSGNNAFTAKADDDVTSFFLTDYLARHFNKLIWQGLGLDRHPELRDAYFGNYRKLVYLAQTEDEAMQLAARAAASQLSLEFEYRFTGYGELESDLRNLAVRQAHP